MPRQNPAPVPTGNVVKTYTDGNTRVLICDDACRARTPQQQRASLDAWAALAARRPGPR